MDLFLDLKALHSWFKQNRREFPWREKPTPYGVLISEVMLQQTRSSVVIPYYERWMRLFPDVATLAKAPLQDVIKAWEGLGYYSRAMRLHEGAIQIMEQFGGKIPSKREQLAKIKGLGPYTIHAILSFAFHKRAAALDGNAIRVLSRFLLFEEEMDRAAPKRKLQVMADRMLDAKKPWVTTEALIELGATVCQQKPLCDLCPLRDSCLAFKHKRAEELPVKAKKPPITTLTRSVAVIQEGDCLLLRKEKPGKVMAGLYEFPYFEGLAKPLVQHLKDTWGMTTTFVRSLPFVKHSFTRYQAHLFPIQLQANERRDIEDFEWIDLAQVRDLPFSSGHKQILSHFLERIDSQLVLFS